MKFDTISLFTWSALEKNRIAEPRSDMKNVEAFKSLEPLVQHSLKVPNLIQTHTPAGNQLKVSQPIKRPFQDEEIVRKLLQYKDRIPLSARILRPGSTSSS